MRADQETGGLIITQMLERIYFADLVLADMNIPNGNVYYEVGVRHAARPNGCVLLKADWAHPLFDAAQMRTLSYPLSDGNVSQEAADAIREALQDKIPALASGLSPIGDAIKGYPGAVDPRTASSMKKQMAALAAFQARVRAVRAAPRNERIARAKKLSNAAGAALKIPAAALALASLFRDSVQNTGGHCLHSDLDGMRTSHETADEWVRPTLLAAAFDLGAIEKAEQLATEVRREGAAQWQLESVKNDLTTAIAQCADAAAPN